MTSLGRLRTTLLSFGRVISLVSGYAVLLGASTIDTSSDECDAKGGIKWRAVITQALLFNAVQNGFRAGTQDYTQSRLGGKFFEDWGRSIENLHGWGDGDYFLTNYVLHPMQGSINGFIFVQNDPKYSCAEFGRNRQYWKSRARAALFSFAASEALEIGPISEASMGNAQQYYPQWGLVDHVITPTVGLGWMVTEDFLDKYLITRLETRMQSAWTRALVRSTLNPGRSMANLMAFRSPWYRQTRSNQLSEALLAKPERPDPPGEYESMRSVPIFELTPSFMFMRLDAGHSGSLACVGGGASGTFHLNGWFGIAADVNGCKMLSPGPNRTGDFLNYTAGPRFTFRNRTRWNPYLQALVGGARLSTETLDWTKRPAKTSGISEMDLPQFHESWTSQDQTNSFALKFGVGVERVVNDAFAVRVIDVEDVHLWARTLNGRHYPNNIAVTTGVIVRFGTW